jgi:peptidoglycan hydrolase-like protein with peptidoglycan-binding domain
MIQLGAKGYVVRDLQTALVEAGFMAKSQIDADFGKRTEQALQRFQLQNGLTADSIAGFDAVVLLTDHSDFDYGLILQHAQLIVDTRGKYRAANSKVVKA